MAGLHAWTEFAMPSHSIALTQTDFEIVRLLN